jgi:hypothetical protein
MLLSGISANAADETFEAASIKPNNSGSEAIRIMPLAGGRFTATNVSLGILVSVAYDIRGFQISGLPGWAWLEKYDVVARAMKGFALVQDKHGAKGLKSHAEECGPVSDKDRAGCGGFIINIASLDGFRVNMKQLASTLAQQRDVGRPVIDKTGIAGNFDISLQWSTPAGDEAVSVFTALQEQLGLRLDSESIETEMLIVDGAERPSEN